MMSRIRQLGFILLFLLRVNPLFAAESPGFDHSHAAWSGLLAKYVASSGAISTVDYASWEKNQKPLQAYLASLSGVTKQEFSSFTDKQKLAFLINAYNAFTVRLVLDHYPVRSIKDIGSLFKSAWKIKFFKLVGEQRNLDDVEHNMIRKTFAEPRIHFAVNCASVGCPALRAEAYTADKLDAQLDDATRAFLRDKSRNRYNSQEQELQISKIFDWYGADFTKASGSVRNFVAPYITDDPALQTRIRSQATGVSYLAYDWNLNGR